MTQEELIFEKENGVATLTLNRPERLNGMSMPVREGIQRIAEEVNRDDAVRVLIITGAGKAFCSGADVDVQRTNIEKGRPRQSRYATVGPLGAWGLSLSRLRKPIIGAINGIAAGGGLSLSLLCDIRIASEDARFCAVWVRRGLVPDVGASALLPQVVGAPQALQMIFTGDVINAAEAERIGLVNKVVPRDQLMPVVKDMAARIAKGPSVAIELAKAAVSRRTYSGFEDALYMESYGQKQCYTTEDHIEGVKSFFEKRPAQFKGQ